MLRSQTAGASTRSKMDTTAPACATNARSMAEVGTTGSWHPEPPMTKPLPKPAPGCGCSMRSAARNDQAALALHLGIAVRRAAGHLGVTRSVTSTTDKSGTALLPTVRRAACRWVGYLAGIAARNTEGASVSE